LTPLEIIWYNNLRGRNDAVIHHGDKTSAGQGDNEVIDICFDKLDQRIECIWIVITVFTEEYTFANVEGAFCRLFDENLKELCYYNLSENKDGVSTGCIMCCI
jgi:stress response protein SCP2